MAAVDGARARARRRKLDRRLGLASPFGLHRCCIPCAKASASAQAARNPALRIYRINGPANSPHPGGLRPRARRAPRRRAARHLGVAPVRRGDGHAAHAARRRRRPSGALQRDEARLDGRRRGRAAAVARRADVGQHRGRRRGAGGAAAAQPQRELLERRVGAGGGRRRRRGDGGGLGRRHRPPHVDGRLLRGPVGGGAADGGDRAAEAEGAVARRQPDVEGRAGAGGGRRDAQADLRARRLDGRRLHRRGGAHRDAPGARRADDAVGGDVGVQGDGHEPERCGGAQFGAILCPAL